MKLRQLGQDGPMVPVICFGAWPIGGGMGSVDTEQAISTVHAAISEGITFIDTAELYNESESILGKALKGYREKIFLASKVSGDDHSESHIRSAVDNSLKALNTDYLDLYQLHGMKTDDDFEKVMADDGAIKTFQKAKEKGLVKYLGFSCHSEKVAKRLIEAFDFDSILMPVNWSVFLKYGFGSELLSIAKEKGLAILALKSMALQMWDDPKNRKYKNCIGKSILLCKVWKTRTSLDRHTFGYSGSSY